MATIAIFASSVRTKRIRDNLEIGRRRRKLVKVVGLWNDMNIHPPKTTMLIPQMPKILLD